MTGIRVFVLLILVLFVLGARIAPTRCEDLGWHVSREGTDLLLNIDGYSEPIDEVSWTAFEHVGLPSCSSDFGYVAFTGVKNGNTYTYVWAHGFRGGANLYPVGVGGSDFAPIWSQDEKTLTYWDGSQLKTVSNTMWVVIDN